MRTSLALRMPSSPSVPSTEIHWPRLKSPNTTGWRLSPSSTVASEIAILIPTAVSALPGASTLSMTPPSSSSPPGRRSISISSATSALGPMSLPLTSTRVPGRTSSGSVARVGTATPNADATNTVASRNHRAIIVLSFLVLSSLSAVPA